MTLLTVGAAIASYWWVAVAVGGALLIAAQLFLGWQVATLFGKALDFLKTPSGQIGAAVVVFFLVASSLVQWGRNIEKGRCDTASKDARIASLEKQIDVLTQRQEYAAEVERMLSSKVLRDAEELKRLNDEVSKTKLQSTKPGSKKDAKALLDDRCNYTAYGANRVSAP